MGNLASRTADASTEPEIVQIDRSEIPEAYKNVFVSEDVIRRAHGDLNSNNVTRDESASKLNEELARQQQENKRLQEQIKAMQENSELQQRKTEAAAVSAATTASVVTSAEAYKQQSQKNQEDIKESKRVFEETVEKVEKQFFNRQKENACEKNEKDILDCFSKNPNKVLACKNLQYPYEHCISVFNAAVLKEKNTSAPMNYDSMN
ncbi:MICOS complex subunit MIC19 [Ditylenchus destructor]|uniref:MICOS complex subunit MIC19 n=1 Tax=Ditylenchus destructor TaxID=166010 RepID=A0AAD4NDN1_9BILA|nr:MICOS complex subunit MIC19 [Ditylenchus destructor]